MNGNDDDDDKALGPVGKLRWLSAAAALPVLSRAETAALIIIADVMNSKTGVAWLSMSKLGERTGTNTRTANRIISRLVKLGLVELIKRGSSHGSSNHYTLSRHYFKQEGGSVTHDTTLAENGGSVTQDTTIAGVVSPSVKGSDVESTRVVSPVTPISIQSSEPLAKDDWNRSQAEAGIVPLRPRGACGPSRQPKRGSDKFPAFCEHWPHRADVAATERAIAEALAEGVDLSEIIAGTERFTQYCKATGTPPRLKPSIFVRNDKWVDDWQQPKERVAKTAQSDGEKTGGKKKSAKSTGEAKAKGTREPRRKRVWVSNPASIEWDVKHREALGVVIRKLEAAGIKDKFTEHPDLISANQNFIKANPQPGEYLNTKTGQAWGRAWDGLPADDWLPPPDGG